MVDATGVIIYPITNRQGDGQETKHDGQEVVKTKEYI